MHSQMITYMSFHKSVHQHVRLSGVLPQTLPGFLQQLSLDNNRFNGSIPTSYKSLASLKVRTATV